MRKIKIGFFSLTCDEGCTITFLEILNEKYQEWKDKIEIKHMRILQKKSEIQDLDVAFIEGAVSTQKELEKVKKIRENSKIVVAIGSCAINGSPSNLRNFFDKRRKEEIKKILEKFGYMDKVLSVKDIIKVDYEVPGCPMMENKFIEVMEKIIRRFENAH
ncbi:MAG: hypothetical protein J7L39_02185 [Candidatus Aenigmarchaeota archaeon]|nr:hypothetical protein [Candidatus Aenigmarchaeota archaeon]